jgi:hypothetical protein
VQAKATEALGSGGKPEYKVNQYSIAYLIRF